MTKKHQGLRELKLAWHSGISLLIPIFIFSVFTNLLLLTGPLFMLQIYDRVLASRSEETLLALFLLVGMLYLFLGLLDYARGRVLVRFASRFQALLDERVFGAVLKSSGAGGQAGQKSHGLRHLETVQKLLSSPAMLSIFDLPWAPLFIFAIFVFHPTLGWIAVAGALVLATFTMLNNRLTRTRAEEAQSTSLAAHGLADTASTHARLILAQGMDVSIRRRWQELRGRALTTAAKSSDWSGLFTASTKSFRLFLQSAILAAGALLTLRGELSAGAIVASSILMGRALAPIEQILGHWQIIQRAIASWRLLAELLNDHPVEPDKLVLGRPIASLSARGITVHPPLSRAATLKQVSFDLGPGQILGIVGKSGAGKSTLAEMIVGLQRPTAGELRIGGAATRQFRQRDLASYIGYLPQNVTLFDGTVAENIARMEVEPDSDKVIAAAKKANAHDFILALPDGYQTRISYIEGRISGGQRQRIALARALYNDPVLLILDEPNSSLDAEGSLALNQAMREFRDDNRAVVIMTHRPQALSTCDRLIVLDEGRIIAAGPRDDILKKLLRKTDTTQKFLPMAVAK
ncbi:type I secretion system permease/ATPase [Sulfitobacter sp. MF3-043]|uniref:type I secretion system permease/ATPase n=1 Tax=Sulfitobacter sediminivivens TaxID=3252902 RepID=UPI0036DD80AD